MSLSESEGNWANLSKSEWIWVKVCEANLRESEWNFVNLSESEWNCMKLNKSVWDCKNRSESEQIWVGLGEIAWGWASLCEIARVWDRANLGETGWIWVSESGWEWGSLNKSEFDCMNLSDHKRDYIALACQPEWDWVRQSESVWIRSKTSETPPFPPISYPALAGLIGMINAPFSHSSKTILQPPKLLKPAEMHGLLM